jgi:hypothetical protein
MVNLRTRRPMRSFLGEHAIELIAALLGLIAVLLMTRSVGLGFSPDSASYVAAGRSLAALRGLEDIDARPYLLWPPLYPVALSVFSLVELSELSAARYLNAALLGAVVALVVRAVRLSTGSRLLAIGGGALTVASPWLLFTYSHLLSDPLFITLSVLFLVSASGKLATASPRSLAGYACSPEPQA